jgi:hypothetical protein
MNKLLILIVIVALAAGALWLFFQGTSPKEEARVIAPQKTRFQMSMEMPQAQRASLLAVEGSTGFGMAYRLFQEGVFSHGVLAEMPLPAPGSVYEGWLVQPSPLQFFSTGVMTQNEHGQWELEYTAAVDYPSYSKVVITQETLVDETPEAHILEGDF